MKNLIKTKALLLGLVIGLSQLNLSTQAQTVSLTEQASNGQQQLDISGRVPRLISSSSTSQAPYNPSIYYFTIAVPTHARDALKAIAINQKPGYEKIAFIADQSRAAIGENWVSGSPVTTTSIGGSQSQDNNEVLVVFNKPVLPGQTVTVGVKVQQNPQYGGIYSFGITAYPENESSPSLYLGSTRLTFSEYN